MNLVWYWSRGGRYDHIQKTRYEKGNLYYFCYGIGDRIRIWMCIFCRDAVLCADPMLWVILFAILYKLKELNKWCILLGLLGHDFPILILWIIFKIYAKWRVLLVHLKALFSNPSVARESANWMTNIIDASYKLIHYLFLCF